MSSFEEDQRRVRRTLDAEIINAQERITELELALEKERSRNLDEIQKLIEKDEFLNLINLKDLDYLLELAGRLVHPDDDWGVRIRQYRFMFQKRIAKLEAVTGL